jgi:poly(3-hydroxybutyrate) depolymerase
MPTFQLTRGFQMEHRFNRGRRLAAAAMLLGLAGLAHAQDKPIVFNAACPLPPALHCPDNDCPGAVIINPGQVVEMKTRRTYFLDYPCELKQGEKVTFILNLHGGGSFGNWQRHYFPAMDFKDKYRLVVATPNSPVRAWSEVDDAYLQNIVNTVVDQIGKENIRAFWLVGHSQGGLTSNRLIRTEFFKARADGFVSLSGGRLGGNPERASAPRPSVPAGSVTATVLNAGSLAAAVAALRELPDGEFSHIYATGEREVKGAVPETSEWAKRLGCDARGPAREVEDTKPGYVYDGSQLRNLNPSWGLLPAGGKAQIFEFPNCKNGYVVADVVRLQKGHTEGLEPNITEEIIKLILKAPGGKIQKL